MASWLNVINIIVVIVVAAVVVQSNCPAIAAGHILVDVYCASLT